MATARAIEAAKAFVRLYMDDKDLRAGLSGLKTTIAGAAGGLAKVGAIVGGAAITGGIGLVTSGFAAATASVWRFVDAGAGLDDIANRTGASAEGLSQLRYAAEQSGTDLAAVEKAMRKLGDVQTQAAAGSKSAAAALASVGLSAGQLAAMSVEDRFLAVADGISRIQDPAAKASLAMDLLGKSGADLVPMMEEGSAGIRGLMAEANQLGLTISGPQAKAAAAFDDSWQQLTAALRASGNVIAVQVIPYAVELLQFVLKAVPAMVTLGQAIAGSVAPVLAKVGDLIAGLIPGFGSLTSAVSASVESFGGIVDALSAGEAELAAEIFWKRLQVIWGDGIDALGDTWAGWKSGFVGVFESAMFAIQRLWLRTYNFIETSVAELMDAIDITGSGSTFGKEAAALGQARIAAIDRQAQATKTAREKALEGSVNAINYDLEQTRAEWAVAVRNAAILAKQQSDQKELQRARSEWAMAVQTARNSAQVAADQPNTANIATGKFTELIKDLKTGDIATRVDKAVQSAGPAQDLRTAAGSSAITRILNQAGQVTAQQQKILLEQRDIQRRLLAVTERGALAYQV